MALDSRVADPKKRGLIQTPWGQSSAVFCANCGERCGLALNEDVVPLIIYICDLCAERNGPLPGFEEVSEQTIRQFYGGRDIQFSK